MPIVSVELQEFLFATTSAEFASKKNGQLSAAAHAELRDHIRGAMRMHRFAIFTWLLLNGVQLPRHLLDDRLHTEVGNQQVDKPA